MLFILSNCIFVGDCVLHVENREHYLVQFLEMLLTFLFCTLLYCKYLNLDVSHFVFIIIGSMYG